ncbi:hypothetical protein [Vibrio cyclitrophicus]|uniref:hypothetical protein n=1 Tax=Vibrio cyclitrophicus TaxID=47951 RepID=UPI0002ECF1D8|nr:hypothetical protein [Vibrio cyclitrophicus]OEF51788.1 hypothetical protein OAC_15210 [Vibrio cyclitrophicus 1F273]
MKHPSSIKVLKSTMLIVGVLLVGCKDKNLFEKVEDIEIENSESIEVETQSFQISEVIVTADSRTFPVKSIITFEVFAETEALFDGPQDIAAHASSSRVNISTLPGLRLESMDPDILSIPYGERIGIARKEGPVTVYAHFRGVQSAPLKLKILPLLTSCGQVNNTDKNNSGETCLKVVKGRYAEAKNKLFTGTPSLSFLNALNYRQEDTVDNAGKTYASSVVGVGLNATASALFGLFRQDGQDATLDGTQGQYDRYCQHLAEIQFLERRDWRRATGLEFSALYQGSGNFYDNYGVFNQVDYWTASQSMPGQQTALPFEFFSVALKNTGFVFPKSRTVGLAASCVSAKASHP